MASLFTLLRKGSFVCVWHAKPSKTYLKELYERTHIKPDPSKVQVGVVPVEMKTPEDDGKLFVGDALSSATPIMGEGLRPALISAKTAAKAVAHGDDYQALLKKEFGFGYSFSAFMRDKIWDLPPEGINDIMIRLRHCPPKTIYNFVKTKITLKDAFRIGLINFKYLLKV